MSRLARNRFPQILLVALLLTVTVNVYVHSSAASQDNQVLQRTPNLDLERQRPMEQDTQLAQDLIASPMALGDARADLVFTPVEPCRIADTRLDALGAIETGFARNFYVAGISGFDVQGGEDGGCNIPFGDAAAVFINFVAVTPTGAGHLTAFAYEDPDPPLPTAAVLNYGSVTDLYAIGNGVVVPICDTLLQTCDFDLIIYAYTTTHVVADVYGYFAPPVAP